MGDQRIATLGPPGTNCHEAVLCFFPSLEPRASLEQIRFVPDNTKLLEQLEDAEINWVVAPIRNNFQGVVEAVAESWLDQEDYGRFSADDRPSHSNLRVVREFIKPVHHHLLAHQTVPTVTKITRVGSHPQALLQCVGHLQRLGLTEWSTFLSTAAAAEAIQREGSNCRLGALATELAAALFDLKVLVPNMQDRDDNCSVFHLIGRAEKEVSSTGHDKTALLCVVPAEARLKEYHYESDDDADDIPYEDGIDEEEEDEEQVWELEPDSYYEPSDATALRFREALFATGIGRKYLAIHEYLLPFREENSYSGRNLVFYVEVPGHYSDWSVQELLTTLSEMSIKLVTLGSFPCE